MVAVLSLVLLGGLGAPLSASAAETRVLAAFGGTCGQPGYEQLVEAASAFWFQPTPIYSPDVRRRVRYLAERDIAVIYQVNPWGWIAGSTRNPLDLYYNFAGFRQTTRELIESHFRHPDPADMWAVFIGDEEVGNGYHWDLEKDPLPPDISKYAEIYHRETGRTLKPPSRMNVAQRRRFDAWLEEKNNWAYSWLYRCVKSSPGAGHVRALQFPMFRLDPGRILNDGFVTDIYDQYRQVYRGVRSWKSVLPDKFLLAILWGLPAHENVEDSCREMERGCGSAYLAGADGVGWFHPDGYAASDAKARQCFAQARQLNRQVSQLPPFRPRPQILVLGEEYGRGFDLFTEYSFATQRAVARGDVDLSAFRLVVLVMEPVRFPEAVRRLNRFVHDGGHLCVLGGRGTEPESGEKLLFERHARYVNCGGRVRMEIAPSQQQTLPGFAPSSFEDPAFRGSALAVEAGTADDEYHVIGTFRSEGRLLAGQSPLVLHRLRRRGAGWTLFWGAAYLEDRARAEAYWREVLREYCHGFLKIRWGVADKDQEGMLISASPRAGSILLGLVNNAAPRRFVCQVDLARLKAPHGAYRVRPIWGNTASKAFVTEAVDGQLSVPIVFSTGQSNVQLWSLEPLVVPRSEKPPPSAAAVEPVLQVTPSWVDIPVWHGRGKKVDFKIFFNGGESPRPWQLRARWSSPDLPPGMRGVLRPFRGDSPAPCEFESDQMLQVLPRIRQGRDGAGTNKETPVALWTVELPDEPPQCAPGEFACVITARAGEKSLRSRAVVVLPPADLVGTRKLDIAVDPGIPPAEHHIVSVSNSEAKESRIELEVIGLPRSWYQLGSQLQQRTSVVLPPRGFRRELLKLDPPGIASGRGGRNYFLLRAVPVDDPDRCDTVLRWIDWGDRSEGLSLETDGPWCRFNAREGGELSFRIHIEPGWQGTCVVRAELPSDVEASLHLKEPALIPKRLSGAAWSWTWPPGRGSIAGTLGLRPKVPLPSPRIQGIKITVRAESPGRPDREHQLGYILELNPGSTESDRQ